MLQRSLHIEVIEKWPVFCSVRTSHLVGIQQHSGVIILRRLHLDISGSVTRFPTCSEEERKK